MTLNLGDGDDTDGYLDGVNGNDTVGDMYASSKSYTIDESGDDIEDALDGSDAGNILSILGGKLYTSADTIDLINVNAADLLKVRVFAKILDLKP